MYNCHRRFKEIGLAGISSDVSAEERHKTTVIERISVIEIKPQLGGKDAQPSVVIVEIQACFRQKTEVAEEPFVTEMPGKSRSLFEFLVGKCEYVPEEMIPRRVENVFKAGIDARKATDQLADSNATDVNRVRRPVCSAARQAIAE